MTHKQDDGYRRPEVMEDVVGYGNEAKNEIAKLKALNAEMLAVLNFVFEACTRLNDAGAVAVLWRGSRGSYEMLSEELTDIENNVHAAIAKADGR